MPAKARPITAAFGLTLLVGLAFSPAACAQSGVVSKRPDVPDSRRGGGNDDDTFSGRGSDDRDKNSSGAAGGIGSDGGGDDNGSGNDGGNDGGNNDGNNDGGSSGQPFQYYFCITTDPNEVRRGNDWSSTLSFDEEVLSRNFVILYQHRLGKYPMAGIHMAQDPGFLDSHRAAIAEYLDKAIPDPGFDGYAAIDYEEFRVRWDRTINRPSDEPADAEDHDFRDDWRDYIRSINPDFDGMSEDEQDEHLVDTYQAAVREFFLATLEECRELRPNAKWTFYGYPYRFFHHRREAPMDVISYGDGSHAGSRRNDEIQWLWDAMDFISPSLYAMRVVEGPEARDCAEIVSVEDDQEYFNAMVRESRRIGRGKPVIPFIANKFYKKSSCVYMDNVGENTLYNQIAAPVIAGADGAILWGNMLNRSTYEDFQAELDNRIMPLMTLMYDHGGSGGSGEAPQDDDDGDDDESRRAEGGGSSSGPSGSPLKAAPVRAQRQNAPMTFRPSTDRISKPVLTREEILEAKRRAALGSKSPGK